MFGEPGGGRTSAQGVYADMQSACIGGKAAQLLNGVFENVIMTTDQRESRHTVLEHTTTPRTAPLHQSAPSTPAISALVTCSGEQIFVV